MHEQTPFDPQNPWSKNQKKKNPHGLDYYDQWKTPSVPRPVTIADLFPRLDRLSIGWFPLLEQLKEVTDNKPSYPPYDIVSLEEDVNLLNVAVAGFTKEELSITVQGPVLTIEGKKETKQNGEVVYRGIATRDFKLELAIAEYWEVTNSLLENGMLTVQFNRELPIEKRPKVIKIN